LYAENHNVEAIGFKVNYSQIKRYSVISLWIKQNDIKIIHLIRSNLLKRLVSHKIANIRDLRHSTQSVMPVKVHIDPGVLVDDFRRRQNRFAKYRKRIVEVFGAPLLEVEYESLTADFELEMHKVMKFIEIDELIPLTSDFVKVNPDSLEEIIENYDEVKRTLKNTEFAKFMN
jgi:hypothetical protein